MKISVDIKEDSAVVYSSVLCRHHLATNGCKPQALGYPTYAILSHTSASTVAATYTVGIAYVEITCCSSLAQKFCNITKFGGM